MTEVRNSVTSDAICFNIFHFALLLYVVAFVYNCFVAFIYKTELIAAYFGVIA